MTLRRLLLLAVLVLPVVVRADGISFGYSSGSVAAGAAIDSGVLLTNAPSEITCSAINAGAASRNLTVTLYAGDGTTVVYASSAIAVGAGLTVAVTIGPNVSAQGGVTALSLVPSRRLRVQLAAGGAAAGQVVCWGRV